MYRDVGGLWGCVCGGEIEGVEGFVWLQVGDPRFLCVARDVDRDGVQCITGVSLMVIDICFNYRQGFDLGSGGWCGLFLIWFADRVGCLVFFGCAGRDCLCVCWRGCSAACAWGLVGHGGGRAWVCLGLVGLHSDTCVHVYRYVRIRIHT